MDQVNTLRTILEPLIKNLEEQLEEMQLKVSNQQGSQDYMKLELDRIKNRLVFLKGQWTDAEKEGSLDEPRYEQGSIEYYRQSLKKYKENLDVITVQDTQNVLKKDNLKPSQKIKMLNNLMKVYNEFKDESS